MADAAVVAVLRAPDPSSAVRGVEALVAGGVTGIEITYSTPDAPSVIAEIARRHGDDVLLGAGTVTTPEQAIEAVDAGARFLVSPGSTDELGRAMLATGVTLLLGALTPSEVMRVSALGAHAVKIFPASLGGPGYLRSLRGPFPAVPFVPTGGVNEENVGTWLSAGAVAVGAGGELCSTADLAAGRYGDIEHRARGFAEAVRQWRAA
ncbi:bifunctional 4-hydroxy-2-oxoglutarate aldolase/2-dehydro-3-deoxy-phosphogluconate aldolase [Actinomadura sp. HBU206391]|nr:bifunctional 4-hydroxy-2-oxoglutarate aldolase/2-dehydro-3-deoxy-phosphogluconate aldolase [Actinomadura sp. HBU206391]